MSMNYPKSSSERHLRQHTDNLLGWSAAVLVVVGMIAFSWSMSGHPSSASNPPTTVGQSNIAAAAPIPPR
jgi:hypothetical protein